MCYILETHSPIQFAHTKHVCSCFIQIIVICFEIASSWESVSALTKCWSSFAFVVSGVSFSFPTTSGTDVKSKLPRIDSWHHPAGFKRFFSQPFHVLLKTLHSLLNGLHAIIIVSRHSKRPLMAFKLSTDGTIASRIAGSLLSAIM